MPAGEGVGQTWALQRAFCASSSGAPSAPLATLCICMQAQQPCWHHPPQHTLDLSQRREQLCLRLGEALLHRQRKQQQQQRQRQRWSNAARSGRTQRRSGAAAGAGERSGRLWRHSRPHYARTARTKSAMPGVPASDTRPPDLQRCCCCCRFLCALLRQTHGVKRTCVVAKPHLYTPLLTGDGEVGWREG